VLNRSQISTVNTFTGRWRGWRSLRGQDETSTAAVFIAVQATAGAGGASASAVRRVRLRDVRARGARRRERREHRMGQSMSASTAAALRSRRVHRQPRAPPARLPEHITSSSRPETAGGERHDGHPDPEHATRRHRKREQTPSPARGQREQRRQPGEHQAVLGAAPRSSKEDLLEPGGAVSSSASQPRPVGSSVRMPVVRARSLRAPRRHEGLANHRSL